MNGQELVASLAIAVDVNEETPVHYVNYAEVGHSAYEFSISVTRVPTKVDPQVLADAKKAGILRLDAVLQLLIPTKVVPGLIEALRTQLEVYERNFGPVQSRSAKESTSE